MFHGVWDETNQDTGVSRNEDPQARWLVKIIENPIKNGGFHSHGGTLKWLVCNGKSESKMNDFLGYPYFRTPPYRKKIL
jgi:hypothetical protein